MPKEERLLPDFSDPCVVLSAPLRPRPPVASPRPPRVFPRSKLYEIKANGMSPLQNMLAYLGGSAIQTVGDNPVTA